MDTGKPKEGVVGSPLISICLIVGFTYQWSLKDYACGHRVCAAVLAMLHTLLPKGV